MFWLVLVFGLLALFVTEHSSVVYALPVTINGTEIKGFVIREERKMRDWQLENGDDDRNNGNNNNNIATVDTAKRTNNLFQRRRSKYFGSKFVKANEDKGTDRREVSNGPTVLTKKPRFWRSRLFRKKSLTDNKDRTVMTTTDNNGRKTRKLRRKKLKNVKYMKKATMAVALEMSSPTSSMVSATKTTIGHGNKQRPAVRFARMLPVTVTQVQEQTTIDKSLTLPCRSFTLNTVQRPKVNPTTDRRQPRTWSCSQTQSMNIQTELSGAMAHGPNVAVMLPSWNNRLAVDGAAVNEDPSTKLFLKISSTERVKTENPC